MIHDINPTILRGENKQCHQSVEDVVKVVFLVDPSVLGIPETVKLVCDILTVYVGTIAVEEESFEKLTNDGGIWSIQSLKTDMNLNAQYAKY